MSNLIPTQRTDKNGRTVIRHMRPVSSAAANASGFPAPSVTSKQTMKERVAAIDAFFRKHRRMVVPSKARAFLSDSTPEELERLNMVLESHDDMPEREKFIVHEAMRSLSTPRETTEFVHELLALRSAFCGEWSVRNSPSIKGLTDFVYGTRESLGASLEEFGSLRFKEEQELREAVAVTRFTYEMDRRFPRQDFRPAEHAYIRSTGTGYLQHKDPALVELLREHCDRVEELIEFAAEHRTCDVQALRAYLEHEGAKSLSSGYL